MGGLFLPIGNAISDGSLIYYITMLVPAFFGNEIFRYECVSKDYFFEGSPPLVAIHLILTFVLFVQVTTVIISIRNILKHKKLVKAAQNDDDYKAVAPEIDGEELEIKQLIGQVLAYIVIQGSLSCLSFIGTEPLVKNDGKPGQISTLFLLTLM